MSKFELSMVSDYVKTWDYKDAIREIVQNALDQSKDDTDNYDISYEQSDHSLIISTKTGVLERKSMLLGNSTKRDDDSTIGKFGEGYKLALLVLSRDGKNVIIENAGAGEIWTPSIVKSRRWGDNVLTIDIKKSNIFNKHKFSHQGVSFIIQNVTPEEYGEVIYNTLQLQNGVEKIKTKLGDILTSEEHQNKLYVGGLYVRDLEGYKYGYNSLPKHLKIGRDRDLTNDYRVNILISTMFMSIQETHYDLYIDLLESDYSERDCLKESIYLADNDEYSYYSAETDRTNFARNYAEKLESEYGDKFVVLTADELNSGYNNLKESYENIGYKLIVKDQKQVKLIREDESYSNRIKESEKGFFDGENNFVKLIKEYYYSDIRKDFSYNEKEYVDSLLDNIIKEVGIYQPKLVEKVLNQFKDNTDDMPF